MFRQPSAQQANAKHTLGDQTKAEACCQSSKKQYKQQQRQPKTTSINIWRNIQSTNLAKNLDSFSLSILSEISQKEYVRQRQNSKKTFLKILAVVQFTFSRVKECMWPFCVAVLWPFCVAVLWPFVNNGKEMNKELQLTPTQTWYSRCHCL